MWGLGAGLNFELESGNELEMNLNLVDTGEAPIDTDFSPTNGRVVGESDNHYAVTFDFSYHWR